MFLSDHSDGADDGPTVIDALSDPEGTAYLLSTRPPSAGGVAAAAAISLDVLSPAGCVDLLVGLNAHIAWMTATAQTLMAHLQHLQDEAADPNDEITRTWLREELSCALRLAPGTARARIETAVSLAHELPATLALLSTGKITYDHARALCEAVIQLDADTTRRVEQRVLGRAANQTIGEFRAAIKRAVMAMDPATAEERHRIAVDERTVAVTMVEDGMAQLWALLPAQGAAVVMEAINSLASSSSGDDDRTIDQRRADALVCLGAAVLNDPNAPRTQGLRPHVQVTVAATTLLGLDELPGELDGYGPIPATLAREIASDPSGTWRRILVDPKTGTLLDYGRTRYRPPPSLAKHVMARDRECSFPHCHRRAHRCDLDHIVRWTDGGITSSRNLQPLCARHHRAKDEFHWTVDRDEASGIYTWTSPRGNTYRKTMPTYANLSDSPATPGIDRSPDQESACTVHLQTSETVDGETASSGTVDGETVSSEQLTNDAIVDRNACDPNGCDSNGRDPAEEDPVRNTNKADRNPGDASVPACPDDDDPPPF